MNIPEKVLAAWEHKDAEVVRTIDSDEDCIERVTKVGDRYWLIRYFQIGSDGQLAVSVDLDGVDADRVIQELAERL